MFTMEEKPIYLVFEFSKGRKDLLVATDDLQFAYARCRSWFDDYCKFVYPYPIKWTIYITWNCTVFNVKDLAVIGSFTYTPSVSHVSK